MEPSQDIALPDALEARAAELAARRLDWNELDFVGWKEFRRMAPAIVRMETGRLERIMEEAEPGSDTYNAMVRARFEMNAFAEGLEEAERSSLPSRADRLQRALLAVSLLAEDSETLRYVMYRLTYIYDRLKLIY